MSGREIMALETADALFVRAAEEIAHLAGETIGAQGEFRLCLAGGATPAAVYELLATRFKFSVGWQEVRLYWGDERCVPPGDPASNFGMAERTMLGRLGLGPDRIHRMRGEDPPEPAARAYEKLLKERFGLGDGEFPRFDLVLLGLGEDCHIASLFPESPAIREPERLCVAVEVAGAVHPRRLTLTPPVINNAARVMFVISGGNKAPAVRQALEGAPDPDRFPAHIVAPADGVVTWLLDRAAASLLAGR